MPPYAVVAAMPAAQPIPAPPLPHQSAGASRVGGDARRQVTNRFGTTGKLLCCFGLAGVIVLVLAVAGVFSSGSHALSPGSQPATSGQTDQTQPVQYTSAGQKAYVLEDLNNIASAEATYFASNGAYTDSAAALQQSGFAAVTDPNEGDSIFVGFDTSRGYCAWGAGGGSGPDGEFLYDSQAGGLQAEAYSSFDSIQAACSDSKIIDYVEVV